MVVNIFLCPDFKLSGEVEEIRKFQSWKNPNHNNMTRDRKMCGKEEKTWKWERKTWKMRENFSLTNTMTQNRFKDRRENLFTREGSRKY